MPKIINEIMHIEDLSHTIKVETEMVNVQIIDVDVQIIDDHIEAEMDNLKKDQK